MQGLRELRKKQLRVISDLSHLSSEQFETLVNEGLPRYS
jgi:hypothetical protein